jgi:hypothetical protein
VSLLMQLIHHANGICFVLCVALCHATLFFIPSSSRWQLRVAGFVFSGSLGLSLSASSVPLSGAYTFVGAGYHEVVVFATGLASIAAPHLMAALFVSSPITREHRREELAWSSMTALAACLSATLQRGHLFVWSVFGPLVAWHLIFLVFANVKANFFMIHVNKR